MYAQFTMLLPVQHLLTEERVQTSRLFTSAQETTTYRITKILWLPIILGVRTLGILYVINSFKLVLIYPY